MSSEDKFKQDHPDEGNLSVGESQSNPLLEAALPFIEAKVRQLCLQAEFTDKIEIQHDINRFVLKLRDDASLLQAICAGDTSNIEQEFWDTETRREMAFRYMFHKKRRQWTNRDKQAWKRVLANERRYKRTAIKRLEKDAPTLKEWKKQIALVMLKYPYGIPARPLCHMLDNQNERKRNSIPLPPKLVECGAAIWEDPYSELKFKRLRPYINVLFSKIAKMARINRKTKLRSFLGPVRPSH